MTLHDLNDIAAGGPARIREEAARLGGVCDEIARVAGRLRQVSTRGVWDSGAGEAFAAHVGEVPAQLDAVRVRLGAAAHLLPPYAALLEDAQERMRDLDERYTQAQRIVDERDRELELLPPEAPNRMHLMAERGEAAAESFRLQQQFMRVSEEILADEKRLAARLSDVCPELDDPNGYDVLEGLSNFGTGPVVNNLATDLFRPAKVARLAHPIGELGHLLVYDEGSWSEVAASAKTAVLGMVKLPKGLGAGVDDVVRQRRRTGEVVAAKPLGTKPPTGHGGRAARLRETTKAKAKQTTAQSKVRGKHLAQDAFENVTGLRLIANMTSDWAAIAAGGRATKAVHIAKYTAASVKQVDSTIRTARTTADTVKPLAGSRSRQEQQRNARTPPQTSPDQDRGVACQPVGRG